MRSYFELSDRYQLESWQHEVFALYYKSERRQIFLTEEEYTVVNMCDGTVDFSICILPKRYMEIAKAFYNQGILQLLNEKKEKRTIDTKNYQCPYVEQAQWSITGNCNYRCKHCYMSAPLGKYGEFSFEECLDIIKQLKECGIHNIALTGGEPLIRKDFLKLLDEFRQQEITVTELYTNGALVDEKLILELQKRNMHPRFLISFDGKNHHDWLRGVEGAEEKAVKAFALLRDHGFQTVAEMCVHRKNIGSIRDTVLLLAELKVGGIKITPASPSGLWKENCEDKMLSKKELFDAYLQYIPCFFEDASPLNIMLGGFFAARKNSRSYSIPSIKFDGTNSCQQTPLCVSARKNMYIAADGKVLPCISLTGLEVQNDFPSLEKERLLNILKDSKYWEVVSATVGELLEQNQECRECEFQYWCGGGCRAGALMSNEKNYFGKDETTCFIFKEGYPAKLKKVLEHLSDVKLERTDFPIN